MLVVFLFLQSAWSNTFNFWFHWLLSRCPKWITCGSGNFVAPPFTWMYQSFLFGASLVFPGLHSIIFTWFGFFVGDSAPSSLRVLGTLSWRVLGVLWRASWEHYGLFLAWFLDSLLLWGDRLHRDISMDLKNSWSRNSCLRKGSFFTLFIAFMLEELLSLIKTLGELYRLDINAVGIYFGC